MRPRDIALIAAFMVVVGLILAGAVLAPIIKEAREKPDLAKMRAYRMSLYTDEQLLQMHASAIKESEQQMRLAKGADRAFWEKRRSEERDCESNPAAKLRDPDHCGMPIVSGSNLDLVQSADALFEERVMGMCFIADSVREAKRYKCLPAQP
jgi:hypothetical protein